MVNTEEQQQEVAMQATILLPMLTASRLEGQDRALRTTTSSMEAHMVRAVKYSVLVLALIFLSYII